MMLSLQKLVTFVIVSDEPPAGRTDNSQVGALCAPHLDLMLSGSPYFICSTAVISSGWRNISASFRNPAPRQ